MKKKLLLIIFLFIYFQSIPQNNPIQFQHLTSKEGLSQGHVLCMMQDSEGYIWAGTYYGLDRYNGYTIDVFNAEKNNPKSMFIDMASSLMEDKDGKIWIGTWGLDIFDKKTETFRHIPTGTTEGTISYGGISGLVQDEKGNIWAATTGGGLNKLEYQTEKITYFKSDQTKEGALKSDFLNEILIDKRHKLWIATEGGGLSRMDLKDESIFTYRHKTDDPKSIPSDRVSSIFEDKDGNLWFGDSKGYLFRYNMAEDNFVSYDFLVKMYESRNIRIMQIDQDLNGDLLLATNGSGLAIFNFKTGAATISLHNANNPKSISSNEIFSILVDKTNTIFVGSFGRGISKFSPYNQKFETHFIPENDNIGGDINAFTDGAEDSYGHLIVGTYNGFVVFDKKTWEYKHFLPGVTYADNKILTVTVAPDESIWFGSMNGLHRYDKNFKKIKSYTFDKNLKDQSIYTIDFDFQKNLWIGLFTKGLLKVPESEWMDRSKPSLNYKLYLSVESDTSTISGNQNWIIYHDKDSNLWIGNNGGLSRYNYKSDDFTRIFNTGLGAVKKVTVDANGKIWMGTIGNGIYSYDLKTGKYKQYTTKDGLCHNFVYGLDIDKNQNIWISTESGLSRFNVATKTFKNYDDRDGLPDNHFDDASDSQLSDGRIYMGTNNGFIVFNPDNIIEDTSETRNVLTALKINNQTLNSYKSTNNGSVVNIPIGQITKIEFMPGQRDFSLEFAALHYVAPYKIQYSYMLDGYDKDWITTNSSNRIARYTNLNGGNYTFLVKSTNADGKWTNDPLKIPIRINPPFYKTFWFLIIILALIISLIFLYFRWRIAQEIKQKQILVKKVDERTIEVTNKNTQLKKTADDLTELNKLLYERQYQIEQQSEEIAAQRDDLELINATKDKLFSIIAHDLKNPFNVILGYSDLLINNYYSWEDGQKLEILSFLKESSGNAYNLLENLLNWSRSQRGTLDFNPGSVNALEIIESVKKDVISFARKKGVEIVNEYGDESVQIYADLNMLSLICRNLLMNAIKFSNTGSKVFINAIDFDANYICFTIRDLGVGMDEEKVETLFNLEKNTSTFGTDGEKGTGLGLLLCRDFVVKHNGKIWVESKVGFGTTFFFTIPKSIPAV